MSDYPIVVIGGSAGAIEALRHLVRDFPANFPAPIFVVVHIYSQSKGLLPGILENAGNLPAVHPIDGQIYQPGVIYVAPPDHHLLLENNYIRLSRGPKENRHRPAIDALFRSAARYHGNRVIAVLLTGMLDDGTAGLMAVKMHGGRSIVQSPADALYPDMPQNAIDHVEVDYILPLEDITGQLIRMMPHANPNPNENSLNPPMTDQHIPEEITMDQLLATNGGRLIPLVCPDCGGALWEMDEGGMLRYHCHVGHAFTAKSLFEAQTEAVEEALWTALRVLKERAALSQQFADQVRRRDGDPKIARNYEEQALHAARQAEIIRKNLLESMTTSKDQQ